MWQREGCALAESAENCSAEDLTRIKQCYIQVRAEEVGWFQVSNSGKFSLFAWGGHTLARNLEAQGSKVLTLTG